LAEGFSNRYFEFQDFEQKFGECISKSAVRTKFEQHSQRGKLIVSEIRQIIDSTYDQAQQLKTQKAVVKKEIHDKLNSTKQQFLLLAEEMKDKVRQMVKDVKRRVSCFREPV
jgi:mitofusin